MQKSPLLEALLRYWRAQEAYLHLPLHVRANDLERIQEPELSLRAEIERAREQVSDILEGGSMENA